MSPARTFVLTGTAMVAFATNSILCRLALRDTAIDPASFTSLRLLSGALVLWFLLRLQKLPVTAAAGNWGSALALFVYAAAFSYAYLSLSAGTGALLLFASVQATMIVGGWHRGERIAIRQRLGLGLAFTGLVLLVMPGLSAPPLAGALLMLVAGIAWGLYSLRGGGAGSAMAATSANFLRSLPLAALLSLATLSSMQLDALGCWYALLSGALASGLGYSVWYVALRDLSAAGAATVQLSVPMIAALGGVALLGEAISLRMLLAALAILGGIALVLRRAAKA